VSGDDIRSEINDPVRTDVTEKVEKENQ